MMLQSAAVAKSRFKSLRKLRVFKMNSTFNETYAPVGFVAQYRLCQHESVYPIASVGEIS